MYSLTHNVSPTFHDQAGLVEDTGVSFGNDTATQPGTDDAHVPLLLAGYALAKFEATAIIALDGLALSPRLAKHLPEFAAWGVNGR